MTDQLNYSDGSVKEEFAAQFAPEVDALREEVSANTYVTTTGGGCIALYVVIGERVEDTEYGGWSEPNLLVTDADDGTLSVPSDDYDPGGYAVGVYHAGNHYEASSEGVDIEYRVLRTVPDLVACVKRLAARAGWAE